MRIGIDARPLRPPQTGVANYVHSLVQRLPGVSPEHRYFLYSNKEIPAAYSETSIVRCTERAFRACPGTIWFLARGGRLSRRERLDVFWATSPNLPLSMPAGVLKVVTVYDLVWLLFPETMTRKSLLLYRSVAEAAVHRSDLVIVISRSTGEGLVQHLGVSPEKIRLVYPGVSEEYRPQNPLLAAEYISRKYSVPSRYMAVVGTVEPRKNLALLVNVLRILKSNGQLDCPLLIAGGSGWKNSDFFRNIETAGLTEKQIRFLGYVPQEDMPLFYAGAQLFLFPSLYEGFGFPPLEAMACGTPVIASNAKCMPEVLGEAAILQSPRNAEGFAEAVVRVLSDEDLRHSMRVAGIQQARRFPWESSVKELLKVFSRRSLQDAVACGSRVLRPDPGIDRARG